MALPVSFYSETINDNTIKDGKVESGTWQVPITTITPANLAAVTSACSVLATARAGLTLGTIAQHEVSAARTKTGAGASTNPIAQREMKYLVRYHDVVTFKKYSVSLPTADPAQHMTNSEMVDLTIDPGLAFKTAFEALVKSSDDSANSVVVDSIQFVGRNS